MSGRIVIESARPLLATQPRRIELRSARPGTTRVSGDGLTVAPGFFDTQINGGFGHDFTSNPESIWLVGEELARFGVTSFLPTIISSAPGTVEAAAHVIHRGPPEGYVGATPVGIHAEGPLISQAYAGTHPLEHVGGRTGQSWSQQLGVSLVTLAPEAPGAMEAIRSLARAGVVVSLGHSATDAATANAAWDAGATCCTHLFNAMAPLHHREANLAAATLSHSSTCAGIIADGLHVAPHWVAVAFKALGPHRLIIVTDAMAGMGAPDGEYVLGDVAVAVSNGEARNPSGGLAGSVLTMDRAVRNLVEFTGCAPDEAIACAAVNPRRLLGLQPSIDTDAVVLTSELEVALTVVGGEIAFRSEQVAIEEYQ